MEMVAMGTSLKLLRRQFLHAAVGTAALPAVSGLAQAQIYPSRPVTMIVAFAAGGGTDVIGRIWIDAPGDWTRR
jgi:tripartite-type tricarboxylate transporter receptor subunit TctC